MKHISKLQGNILEHNNKNTYSVHSTLPPKTTTTTTILRFRKCNTYVVQVQSQMNKHFINKMQNAVQRTVHTSLTPKEALGKFPRRPIQCAGVWEQFSIIRPLRRTYDCGQMGNRSLFIKHFLHLSLLQFMPLRITMRKKYILHTIWQEQKPSGLVCFIKQLIWVSGVS